MTRLRVIPGGEEPARLFEQRMRPHFDVLYRSARRLTRNTADAEDLVQELCVRVYPRLDELATMDNPRSWLLCILYRLFVDSVRHRKSSPIDYMSALEGDDESSFMACGRPSPEDDAESALDAQRLEQAWQRLDRVQRALLALHDIEGYTLVELKEMTGLPEGTLKSRLHRARVRLGKLLRSDAPTGASLSGQEG